MRDREAINRFCAFKILGADDYRSGDMDGFLGRSLEHMNASSGADLTDLLKAFSHSMSLNSTLFGRHAFRKSIRDDEPAARRSIINISMFDVFSVLFAELPQNLNARDKREIKGAVIALIEDHDFSLSISFSTNSNREVHTRLIWRLRRCRSISYDRRCHITQLQMPRNA